MGNGVCDNGPDGSAGRPIVRAGHVDGGRQFRRMAGVADAASRFDRDAVRRDIVSGN